MSLREPAGRAVDARKSRIFCATVLAILASLSPFSYAQDCTSTPVVVGYRGYFYDAGDVTGEPTEEKPESKLWHDNGEWWGILWDPDRRVFRIHQLDFSNQCWRSVGPDVDDRPRSSADVLWDGTKLYIASRAKRNHRERWGPATARLYRFSHNRGSGGYSLDPGFPSEIPGTETTRAMVLTKDSNRKLWVTWTAQGKIWVNRTVGGDANWGTAFVLPTQRHDLKRNAEGETLDISSISAFGDAKVGILWGNQNPILNQSDRKYFFSLHNDNDSDTVWQPREEVLPSLSATGGSKPVADDHVFLTRITAGSSRGSLLAALKLGIGGSDNPRLVVAMRSPDGPWTHSVAGIGGEDHTRPSLLYDSDTDSVYVFAKSGNSDPGKLFIKTAQSHKIGEDGAFRPGLGRLFVSSGTIDNVSNPTSTKQNVDRSSGIVALASAKNTHHYFHNYLVAESAITARDGIWTNSEELAGRPTSGRAWDELLASANRIDQIEVKGGNNSSHDLYTMAAALVALRLDDDSRREVVANNIIKAVNAAVENDGNALGLSRTVTGYIIAADLIDLKTFAPAQDSLFRNWLEPVVYEQKRSGATQVEKHETRGNLEGTQAGVVRIAAAIYLEKTEDLNRAAQVFRGWLGDRAAYAGFQWRELCWQVDPGNPVGILPPGATMIVGGAPRDVDGVLPADKYRAGCPGAERDWPPSTSAHAWEGLQGAVAQAHLLARAGFDAWNWENRAILRAVSWQQDPARGNAQAQGDDLWNLPLVDHVYRTEFWDGYPPAPGRQVGWTDWTHGGDKASQITLRIKTNGPGSVQVLPPGPAYEPGTEVTLTAIPHPGALFIGWGNDLKSLDTSVLLTIDQVLSLTARFGDAENTTIVEPFASTSQTPSNADDPAIWIHPSLPERSVVIGTDKSAGIFVWDMNGNLLQHLPQGSNVNNVDVRQGVKFGGETVDVVAANLRDAGKLAVFKVNPGYSNSDVLIQVAGSSSANNDIQQNSYGFGLYKRPSDDALFVFEYPKSAGKLRQYQVESSDGGNSVSVTSVRELNYTGGTAEGFVADDELGFIYITEEDGGIYKFYADPASDSNPISFLAAGDGTSSDREGLALYNCHDGTGYLVLSSQGNSTVKIYQRQGDNKFLKTVVPLDDQGKPGLGADGLDVTSFAAPPSFPNGFLVVHDNDARRFHIYDWAQVAGDDLVICPGGTVSVQLGINGFTPQSGSTGTEVTIRGANLSAVTSVLFNGTAASDYSIESDREIRAIVPSDALSGPLAVTSATQTRASSENFTVTATSRETLTFRPTDDTFVRSTAPSKNYGNSSELRVRASSTDFDSYLKFRVEGLSGVVTSAKIRLQVIDASPDGGSIYLVSNDLKGTGTPWTEDGLTFDNAPEIAGTPLDSLGAIEFGQLAEFDVTSVISRNGVFSFAVTSQESNTAKFRAREGGGSAELLIATESAGPNAPSISSFRPPEGPVGATVTLSGVNLTGTTSVSFDGIVAPDFMVDSDTQVRVKVPAGAGNGLLVLTRGVDFAISTDSFTVLPGLLALTFLPAHDAYVRSTRPDENVGRDHELKVQSSGTRERFAFLKFDVTGLQGQVQNATISLFVQDGSSAGGAIFPVSNNYADSNIPWEESGIVWNNAPPIAGLPLSSLAEVTAGRVVRFDVTTAIATDGTYSFGITNGSIDLVEFSSKDHTREGISPELVIVTNLDSGPTGLPQISDFTPTSGAVGTEITIFGANLSGLVDVSFNGVAAAAPAIDSDGQVRVEVPTGATSGMISMTNATGRASSSKDFTVLGGSRDLFTFKPTDDAFVRSTREDKNYASSKELRVRQSSSEYRSYLQFEVTGISQPVVSAKLRMHVIDASPQGGSLYSVSNNFLGTSTIWTEADLTFNNAPDIAGDPLTTAGAVGVGEMVEFDVTSAVTGNGIFSFALANQTSDAAKYSSKEGIVKPELVISTSEANAPMISSFTPTVGPVGTVVTISGTRLDQVTKVSFDAVFATSFTTESSSTLLATVPAGASSGKIGLTGPDGAAQSSVEFFVLAPPIITSISPGSGEVGHEVTILGGNFAAVSDVVFAGVSSQSFSVDSAVRVRAVVPGGAGSGAVRVVTAAGIAASPADFVVSLGPGLISFTALEDTYVRSSRASNNYGEHDELKLRKSSSERFVFVKFLVAGLESAVQNASVLLNVVDPGQEGGAIYSVSNNYRGTSTPWQEDRLTWNNAPTVAGLPLSTLGAVRLNESAAFDVTDAIVGEGTYSFAIRTSSSDRVAYSSKEGSRAPLMVIDTGASKRSRPASVRSETNGAGHESRLPTEIVLAPNYPNPFNLETAISYGLPRAAKVTLSIYNLKGQLVRVLVDQIQQAGMKRVRWDGKDSNDKEIGSGVYLLRMVVGEQKFARKITLQK